MFDQSLIHPVILSDGAGTRLWPLSRRDFPKQFILLLNCKSPLQDAVLRISNGEESPLNVICSSAHRLFVAEQMVQIGVDVAKIVLEPVGRNTCLPAAVAALMVRVSSRGGSFSSCPLIRWCSSRMPFEARARVRGRSSRRAIS